MIGGFSSSPRTISYVISIDDILAVLMTQCYLTTVSALCLVMDINDDDINDDDDDEYNTTEEQTLDMKFIPLVQTRGKKLLML